MYLHIIECNILIFRMKNALKIEKLALKSNRNFSLNDKI